MFGRTVNKKCLVSETGTVVRTGRTAVNSRNYNDDNDDDDDDDDDNNNNNNNNNDNMHRTSQTEFVLVELKILLFNFFKDYI